MTVPNDAADGRVLAPAFEEYSVSSASPRSLGATREVQLNVFPRTTGNRELSSVRGRGSEESVPIVAKSHGGAVSTANNPLVNTTIFAGRRQVDILRVRARNVNLMYAHILAFTMYQSVCQWNLFDAYLMILAKSKGFNKVNTWVGFAECITGMTTLILAFPLGLAVDAFDRIKLVRLAASVGCVSTLISAYAFEFDHLVTLYANLFLWGVFTGLTGTAAEAIFADSVEKGNSSAAATFKGMLNTVGLSLGPSLMVALFLALGDVWTLEQLHIPLLVGCIFAPLSCVPLMLMQDPQPNQTLPLQAPLLVDEAANIRRQSSMRPPVSGSSVLSPNPSTLLFRRERMGSYASEFDDMLPYAATASNIRIRSRRDSRARSQHAASDFEGCTATEQLAEDRRFALMSKGQRMIPLILTVSDFILDIGAGMTVRFFPLFFINDYSMGPRSLCLMFAAYPLCTAAAMPVCQRLSTILGRAQTSFIFQSLGVCALVSMAYVQNFWLLVAIFIVRGQLQNAPFPVDRSILIDFVPSKHRGKWNSVAALSTMTWSGSAVLGGLLADQHDYRYTFLITAIIYVVGVLAYSPLLFLVPRKEKDLYVLPPPAATSAEAVGSGSQGIHRKSFAAEAPEMRTGAFLSGVPRRTADQADHLGIAGGNARDIEMNAQSPTQCHGGSKGSSLTILAGDVSLEMNRNTQDFENMGFLEVVHEDLNGKDLSFQDGPTWKPQSTSPSTAVSIDHEAMQRKC